MQVWFDMDGTIADFYSVDGWLDMLIAEDENPYKIARPLVNMSRLARTIHKMQAHGIEVGIISWASRGASAEYAKRIESAKIEWLHTHLPSVTFDSINVIPYGTPKSTCGNGILFDDEERNRVEWRGESFSEKEIFSVLASLI